MPDVFTKAKRSEVMSRIRGRGNKEHGSRTGPLLRRNKITGWRSHVQIRGSAPRGVTGPCRAGRSQELRRCTRRGHRSAMSLPLCSPGLHFPKTQAGSLRGRLFLARLPKTCNQPANNRAFWLRKLSVEQGARVVTRTLRRAGWRVLRVWEHELARKKEKRLLRRIQRVLDLNR